MLDWLLQKVIKEVPEELSFCEFECPRSKCCVTDGEVCDLLPRAMPRKRNISRYSSREVETELPVFAMVPDAITL